MRQAANLARAHLASCYRWIQGREPKLRSWKRCGRYFVSRAEVLGLFTPVNPGAVKDPAPTAALEAQWARHRDEVLRRAGLAQD